ncbi:class I SAM-dependent methyltransferase [archaeon]|nr:class I SAM-dependent methyltransferase [archaeon]MBT4397249.1 class I SAM-dependent methyltransferase [archaeon]MBT4440629.1 class I SAM-dependent methyltransferase [archaeon]
MVTDLRMVDKADPTFGEMDVLQRFGLNYAERTILLPVIQGQLESDLVKGRVLDFGCGEGGPTYFFVYNGADVTAVDLSKDSIDRLVNTGILPAEKAIAGDGIEYMREQPEDSYDLVTAFWLDPSFGRNPGLTADFFREAQRVSRGGVLITSDMGTQMAVEEQLSGYGQILAEGTEYRSFFHRVGESDSDRLEARMDGLGSTKSTIPLALFEYAQAQVADEFGFGSGIYHIPDDWGVEGRKTAPEGIDLAVYSPPFRLEDFLITKK